MAYIRLPLGIRIALEYEIFGKVIVNVYHVTSSEPIVSIKLLELAVVFREWWFVSLSTEFASDIALTTVTALNLDVPNGEKQTLVVAPPMPGTLPPPAASNNVAIVASFATAKTGRSFRGRTYLAGLRDVGIAENHIGVLVAADIITHYVALIVALNIENSDLVVASFQAGGIPRVEGVATVIESVSVNTRVDTQRRRLPKT